MLLREWRKRKGYTQLMLAEKLGVHQTAVSAWERAARRPRADQMQEIARLTDGMVTPNDFFALLSEAA